MASIHNKSGARTIRNAYALYSATDEAIRYSCPFLDDCEIKELKTTMDIKEKESVIDKNAREIFKLLFSLRNKNRIIIFATHNRYFADMSDCKLSLIDGKVSIINARN